MTTATKPRRKSPPPAHGTSARGNGSPGLGIPPCPCTPCRKAKYAADKRRAYLNATGRPIRIPAAPVARHLRLLLDAGMGWNHITAAGSCSASTISRLLAGQELVRREVADRLLAITYTPADARRVDATGARRRLQALVAIGHTVEGKNGIATAAGVDHSVISHVVGSRQTRIFGSVHDRIDALYQQWKDQPGQSVASRNRAQRHGWHGPDAWDPDTIDDPHFDPDATGRAGTRAQQVAEDARWLLATGHDRDQAAERLGVSRFYIDRALRENPAREETAA